MVYSEVVHVVGILLVMLTLLYYSSLVIYGMVVVQSSVMYSLVLAEVTEQVEFGVFQKLGDKSTKNKVLYKL
jgi:hypothetical protein